MRKTCHAIVAICSLTAVLPAGAVTSIYTSDTKLLGEVYGPAAGPRAEQDYVWFGDVPVAQFHAQDGAPRWTFADHLGTPVLQTDSASAVVWRIESEPFGASHRRVDDGVRQPLRFPGQESDDAVADRVYNVERWYRPEWGRYTQPDPIPSWPDRSAYAYVDDNPAGSSDPLGLYATNSLIYKFAVPTPESNCGSKFACSTKVTATVTCSCKCEGGDRYGPDPALLVTARIYYYNGNFAAIHDKSVDPNVKDAASAIHHEYDHHIDVAVRAVDPLVRELESKTFKSQEACRSECSAVAKRVNQLFNQTLDDTNRKEHATRQ